MDNSLIDVSTIVPDAKDRGRAAKLVVRNGSFHSLPFRGNASKMAQAIDDPVKLVRRAKAVAHRYGTGPYYLDLVPEGAVYTYGWREDHYVWEPFAERLRELGFTRTQVREIAVSR